MAFCNSLKMGRYRFDSPSTDERNGWFHYRPNVLAEVDKAAFRKLTFLDTFYHIDGIAKDQATHKNFPV
jgi:hypothetical protein